MNTNGPTLAETAPSRLHADEPTLARYVGGIGWGVVVVGLAIVTANRMAPTPRFFSEGWGWLFLIAGIVMALVHSSVETDLLLRRVLGLVGAALVVVGVGWGGAMIVKERSWAIGLIPAVPGLFLIGLYIRREEDELIRRPSLFGLGGTGLLLALAGVVGTMIQPQAMPARYSVLMVLGFLLTLMFLGLADVADEWAFLGALAFGVLGAVAFIYAALRATIATLVYEWRSSPETEHLAAIAAGACLLVAGLAANFLVEKPGAERTAPGGVNLQKWGRIGGVAGLLLMVLGAIRYFAPSLLISVGWGSEPPRPYLMPTGFVLLAAGAIFCLVAIGFVSDNRLVVLTRRELTAFFVSPIAYFVMAGFVVIAAWSYYMFLGAILERAERQMPLEEPIVQGYVIAFFPVVAAMLAVPLLTMRLFSEEKRTGTLEVLLTAPVNDWHIVLSKFAAAWIFFLLLWLPWWLYLLGLRLEGGQEFDFRPMIGLSLSLLACGAAFTSMGVFFSSLTRDQIISAALTLMGMFILVGCFFVERNIRGASSVATAARSVMRALSFISMWIEATEGKLYVRDIFCQLCVAVFWLFATVKVLEIRRWS
jgi:ABC-2 type transport system permease protein